MAKVNAHMTLKLGDEPDGSDTRLVVFYPPWAAMRVLGSNMDEYNEHKYSSILVTCMYMVIDILHRNMNKIIKPLIQENSFSRRTGHVPRTRIYIYML